MRSPILFVLAVVASYATAQAPVSFTNPVVPGDFPDPTVCRVGDDYYLASSSFEYFPGVPILHSRDLVHWRLIGYALTRPSQLSLEGVRSSHGVFAPTLRHHDGVFYLVTTTVGGGGNFFVTAADPAGPWSDPVLIDQAGMDPSLHFDEDGTVYYNRHVGGGDGYIGQATIDPETGELGGELEKVWGGTGGQWAEGPHLYHHGDWWYVMISEGGTSYAHAITVARSKSPFGPYESCPDNPILTHRDQPGNPFQAIGHCDLVETPEGWWAVCLGIRPVAGRTHHLGRETMLLPVTWSEDGWPRLGVEGRVEAERAAPALPPHPWPDLPVRDEFDASELALAWNFVRNPSADDWSLDARPGFLRLRCSSVTLDDLASPAYVCRRQTGMSVRFATRLDFQPDSESAEAGLAIRMVDGWHYDAVVTERDGGRVALLRKVKGDDVEVVGEPIALADGPVELTLVSTPTEYRFSVVDAAGKETEISVLSPQEIALERINAAEQRFFFTGARVGVIATANGKESDAHADFDWVDFEVLEK